VDGPAQTVEQFMGRLTPERRVAAEAIRATILANLPAGFAESLDYGMLAYGVPLAGGRSLTLVSLADHGYYMALYVNCVRPGGEEAFYARWRESVARLETGARAVRFRAIEDVALDAIAELVADGSPEELRAAWERARGARRAGGEAAR
jgi:hypothetical protein